jgi:hypothetical protein
MEGSHHVEWTDDHKKIDGIEERTWGNLSGGEEGREGERRGEEGRGGEKRRGGEEERRRGGKCV